MWHTVTAYTGRQGLVLTSPAVGRQLFPFIQTYGKMFKPHHTQLLSQGGSGTSLGDLPAGQKGAGWYGYIEVVRAGEVAGGSNFPRRGPPAVKAN